MNGNNIRISGPRLFLSLGICTVFASIFILISDNFIHWFIVPWLMLGVILVYDGLNWFDSRNIWNVKHIVSCLFIHLYFISPALHIYWDYWLPYKYAPQDYRTWIGIWLVCVLAGIFLYFITLNTCGRSNKDILDKKKVVYSIDYKFLFVLSVLCLFIGGLIQMYILEKFQGISGVISSIEERIGQGPGANPFRGLGVYVVIAESIPITLFIMYAVIAQKITILKSKYVVFISLVLLFILLFIFGGLRGSRLTVVFTMLWAFGIIYFTMYRYKFKTVVVTIIIMFIFMNAFFFYKRGGLDVLMNIQDESVRQSVLDKTKIESNFAFTLLNDFSRANTQVLAFYNYLTDNTYNLSFGRSYIGALFSVIPSSIWPDRPLTVRKERTEIMFGTGSFDKYRFVPWIFGYSGEALLNFGITGFILSFIVFGMVVSWIDGKYRNINRSSEEPINYFLPLITISTIILFMADSHVFIASLVKFAFIPLIIVLASLRKHKIKPAL